MDCLPNNKGKRKNLKDKEMQINCKTNKTKTKKQCN